MATERTKSRAWLFDFFTMVAVIIGLIYGGLELRSLRAAQERESVLELYRTIQTPEFVRGLRLLRSIPANLSPEELAAQLDEEDMLVLTHLMMTSESTGIMVYRGDASLEWVDEFYRWAIVTSWQMLGPTILRDREEVGYSGMFEWFQWLAERLLERTDGRDPVPAYEAYREWEG